MLKQMKSQPIPGSCRTTNWRDRRAVIFLQSVIQACSREPTSVNGARCRAANVPEVVNCDCGGVILARYADQGLTNEGLRRKDSP